VASIQSRRSAATRVSSRFHLPISVDVVRSICGASRLTWMVCDVLRSSSGRSLLLSTHRQNDSRNYRGETLCPDCTSYVPGIRLERYSSRPNPLENSD